MGHEAAAGAKAIKANLAARSALVTIVTNAGRVQMFSSSAPQDAVIPYVVFKMRSAGEDSQVINPKRAMTSPLYDVGIWVADDEHSAAAQSGSKEIDTALGSLGSYSVTDLNGDTWEVSARSEGGAWVREEVDQKTMKKFYWVGRSYRLSISAA